MKDTLDEGLDDFRPYDKATTVDMIAYWVGKYGLKTYAERVETKPRSWQLDTQSENTE